MADIHTYLCNGLVFIGHNPETFREMGRAKQSPIHHYIKFNVSYFRNFVIKMFSGGRFIKLTYRGKLKKYGNKLSDADNFIRTSVYARGDR